MSIYRTALTVVAMVLTLGAADAAIAALPNHQYPLMESDKATPTTASIQFCQRYTAECAVNPAEPEVVTMTPALWATLNRVNREVNRAIKPKEDIEHWGVVDRWDFAEDGYGDCEDYQLVKRRTLREQHGLPQRAMRITVVLDSLGSGHAVLMIRTDRGDFILDNMRDAVVAWQKTGYTFVKREGAAGTWVRLAPEKSIIRQIASIHHDQR